MCHTATPPNGPGSRSSNTCCASAPALGPRPRPWHALPKGEWFLTSSGSSVPSVVLFAGRRAHVSSGRNQSGIRSQAPRRRPGGARAQTLESKARGMAVPAGVDERM